MRERAALAALALAAVVAWALVPTYPDYDAYHHLVWGRDLTAGVTPGFEDPFAPTPHPLYLGLAAVLSLAGDHADRLLVLVTVLSLVALVAGAFSLGRSLFGTAAAYLGAFFVASSFAFLLYAVRAYVDVPFLALVVWAAVLEAERRRGAAGLLLLAGLLRPEAWILAGLLWLWRWPGATAGRRIRGAVLVALAPVLWALVDLWVTGDALHSLHATSDLAGELGRERGVGDGDGGGRQAEEAGGCAETVADQDRSGGRNHLQPLAGGDDESVRGCGVGVGDGAVDHHPAGSDDLEPTQPRAALGTGQIHGAQEQVRRSVRIGADDRGGDQDLLARDPAELDRVDRIAGAG